MVALDRNILFPRNLEGSGLSSPGPAQGQACPGQGGHSWHDMDTLPPGSSPSQPSLRAYTCSENGREIGCNKPREPETVLQNTI